MQGAASQHNDWFRSGLSFARLMFWCVCCASRMEWISNHPVPDVQRARPGFCIVWNTVNVKQEARQWWNGVLCFSSTVPLLGVGLAMDAFSVSMANGLHDLKMGKDTMCRIAAIFGVFQAVMPMTGWICVHTIRSCSRPLKRSSHGIALALLGYIGGKMLRTASRAKRPRRPLSSVPVPRLCRA